MKHIGFTGTRHGATEAQWKSLHDVICELAHCHDASREIALMGHHGDCIGADAQFHEIVHGHAWRVVGHLPVDGSHRAFCSFDETRTPLTHMARNRAIVAAADVMLACPYEPTEQPRGGTWATIRMARKAGKPLAIVYPEGQVSYENWPRPIGTVKP